MKKAIAKFCVGALVVASMAFAPASAALSGPGNHRHSGQAQRPPLMGESGYNVVTWDSRGSGDSGGNGVVGATHPSDPNYVPVLGISDFGAQLPHESALPLLGSLEYDPVPDFPVMGFDAPADDTGGNGGNAGLLDSPSGAPPPFVCPPVCIGSNGPDLIPSIVNILFPTGVVGSPNDPPPLLGVDLRDNAAYQIAYGIESFLLDPFGSPDDPPPLLGSRDPSGIDPYAQWDPTIIPRSDGSPLLAGPGDGAVNNTYQIVDVVPALVDLFDRSLE
jgi:hypothetical protein